MKDSEKILRDTLCLKIPGEGKKNYSVMAGAGGGKTTMLSERISRQILEGTPIDRFLIITYTNAAAVELRDKITRKLRKVITDGAIGNTEMNNAKAALNSIELIQISTIHAFLLKVLKKYSFESGVVAEVTMLDDSDDLARKKTFFDDWFRDHFDEIQKYSKDWIVTDQYGYERDCCREVFENMFCDIASVREKIMDEKADHSADLQNYATEYVNTWLKVLDKFDKKLQLYRPLNIDGKTPRALPDHTTILCSNIETVVQKSQKTTIFSVDDARMISKALSLIYEVVSGKKESFYRGTESTVLVPYYPDYPDWELEWNFEKYYTEYYLPAEKANKVVAYVKQMQEAYQKQTDNETKVISNDDILFRAEKLLTAHEDILDKLRNSYDKIYVDEFQDTTDLQTRIVRLLSEKPGTSLENNDLSPDKLLFVGDPKQSIYRFTGAEKALYDKTDRMMKELPDPIAESVELETNFRSNSDIVNWVNLHFKDLIDGYSEMDSSRDVTDRSTLYGVFCYDQPAMTAPLRHDDEVVAEVDLVKKFVSGGNIEVINDKNEPEVRPIQYSDIMIICKNAFNLSKYVNRFAEEGIPVNVQGKFQIYDDVVVRNFQLLMEYFANPKSEKNAYTAAQIVSGTDVTGADVDDLKRIKKELRSLYGDLKKQGMDSAALVQYLLRHEELFVPKNEDWSKEKVRSYRIRLHQMTETCLRENAGGIRELAERMKKYVSGNVKREIPLESNENAIRLMNVHQSKGLTGQIVIIADRSSNEECRFSGFKSNGQYYPSACYKEKGYMPKDKYTPAYGYDINLIRQAYREEREEAVRLEYVAATRAASALIFMPVSSQRNIPWFSNKHFKLEGLPGIKDYSPDAVASTAGTTQTVGTIAVKHSILELEENRVKYDFEKQSIPVLLSITPSGLEKKGTTGLSTNEPGYEREDRPENDIFGLVMHRVYQLIIERYASMSALIGEERKAAVIRIIDQAIMEQSDDFRQGDDPQKYLDYLTLVMNDYFDKVISPIMAAAGEVYTEYSFSFFVNDAGEKDEFGRRFCNYLEDCKISVASDCTIWVNGISDLVVKNNDGTIKIYDYKSDARNGKSPEDFEKALQEKYRGQLELYRYAIGRAFGVPEDKVSTELIHLYR